MPCLPPVPWECAAHINGASKSTVATSSVTRSLHKIIVRLAIIRHDAFHMFCDRGLLPTRRMAANVNEMKAIRHVFIPALMGRVSKGSPSFPATGARRASPPMVASKA